MIKYFTLLSHSTQAKNRLQKEVWAMLEVASNRIVDDLELSIVEIRNDIITLNEKYDRCQPLSVQENRNEKEHVTLYIRVAGGDQGPGVNFTYHLIKQ